MKYLRYPPLIFWLLVTFFLSGIIFSAYKLSSETPNNKITKEMVNPVSQVEKLRLSAAQLPYLTIAPYSGLSDWAITNSNLANSLARERINSGFSLSDPLVLKYITIGEESSKLDSIIASNEHMRILAQTAKIGILTDSLLPLVYSGSALIVQGDNPVGSASQEIPVSRPGESPRVINPVNPAEA
jgi:hypothetical protein